MPLDRWSNFLPWRGFYEALRQGDPQHVKRCLDRDFDFRLPVAMKQNALQFAAYHGHVEVVRAILNHRQFKRLPQVERGKSLIEIVLSASRAGNYKMLEFMIPPHPSTSNVGLQKKCRKRIFELCLGIEDDNIIDLLTYAEPIPPQLDGSIPPKLKTDLTEAFYTGEEVKIRRQKIKWIMKNYGLSTEDVLEILEMKEPLLLLCCIGTVEVVSECVDELEGFNRTNWREDTTSKLGSLEDLNHRNVFSIAALSGRSDILTLLINKAKRKLMIIDPLKYRYLLTAIVDFQIMETNVLECVPDEAFLLCGESVPTSDSYHCLPWFFIGRGTDIDASLVRERLSETLMADEPGAFQFYVDKYNIPPEQVRISSSAAWYIVPEDEDTPLGMNQAKSDPLRHLSRFPLQMVEKYMSRDKKSMYKLIMTGDVRLVQMLNQKFKALDQLESHGNYMKAFFSGIIRRKRQDHLMPLPLLEYLTDHYRRPGWKSMTSRILDHFLTSDGRIENYHLTKAYAKTALQILLTRLPRENELIHDFEVMMCHDIFKAKRVEKIRNLHSNELSRSGPMMINSKRRELLLETTLVVDVTLNYQDTNFVTAKLIAVMDLHDFSKDFGPPIYGPKIHIPGQRRSKRRSFFRDFILGLCGSEGCYLYWRGVLRYLGSSRDPASEVSRHQQMYDLVAKSGIVIVDSALHKLERSPGTRPKDAYEKALLKEHPEITKARRNLSLASLSRIAVHKYLRRTPGFQSAKIKSLGLPEILEDFLLFDDVRLNWDSFRYNSTVKNY